MNLTAYQAACRERDAAERAFIDAAYRVCADLDALDERSDETSERMLMESARVLRDARDRLRQMHDAVSEAYGREAL